MLVAAGGLTTRVQTLQNNKQNTEKSSLSGQWTRRLGRDALRPFLNGLFEVSEKGCGLMLACQSPLFEPLGSDT